MNLRLVVLASMIAAIGTPVWAKHPTSPAYLEARHASATENQATTTPGSNSGDPDSFGRTVKFIGLSSQPGTILLLSDCTPDPLDPFGPDDQCVTLNPAPAVTNFIFHNVAQIVIPGKSTNSMFCYWETPSISFAFANPTGVFQPNAQLDVRPQYFLYNAALNDPSIVNPDTGQPYGGVYPLVPPKIHQARSLQANESQNENIIATRTCSGGRFREALILGGLSPAQADAFFKNDTTIVMDIQGSARMVDFASINIQARWLGD